MKYDHKRLKLADFLFLVDILVVFVQSLRVKFDLLVNTVLCFNNFYTINNVFHELIIPMNTWKVKVAWSRTQYPVSST